MIPEIITQALYKAEKALKWVTENTIELCLCEHDKIIPRTNKLYKYVVDENCDSCKRLKAAYDEEEE